MRAALLVLLCVLFMLPVVVQAVPANEMEEVPNSEDTDSADMPGEVSVPPSYEAAPAKSPAKTQTPPNPAKVGEVEFDTVVLQGLNKVTARVQTIEAPIGSVVRFGTIEIVAHRCWKAAPEEHPEDAALLEISEIKQGEPPTRVFLGWMFASSPGIASLEHPFYDVSVVTCKKKPADIPK